MNELKLKVNGMMCEGCENRIKNALSTLEGVEKVEANHKTGEVKVICNKQIDMSVIAEKIDDIGFEVA